MNFNNCFGAVALSAAAVSPAFAQTDIEVILVSPEAQALIDAEDVYLPEAQWSLSPSPAGCLVQRHFAYDNHRITLAIKRLQPDLPIQYALVGSSFEIDERLQAGFTPGSGLTEIDRIGSATLGERDGLFFAARTFPRTPDGFPDESALAPDTQFFVAQDLRGDAVVLRTGRIDLALSALEACAANELAALGVDLESRRTFTRYANLLNIGDLMTPLEAAYNRSLRNHRSGGTLQIRVVIDPAGRVTHCHAGDDLTPRTLREDACEAVRQNGSFQTALNAQGEPVADYSLQTIVFQAPQRYYEPGADGTVWRRRR